MRTGAIGLGADHAGFRLKEAVRGLLARRGLEVQDFGVHSEDSVHYPDYASQVARALQAGEISAAVLVCGTGVGMAMVANRFTGVRAALCSDCFTARMSREHNDANVLALGARVVGEGLALDIVGVWLDTPFAGGRHQTRLDLFPAGCGAWEPAS